jgi:hypothetical protein
MAKPKSAKDTYDTYNDLKLRSNSQRYTEKELERLDESKADEKEFQMVKKDILTKIDSLSERVTNGNRWKIGSFITLLVAAVTAGTVLGMTKASVAETQQDVIEFGADVKENSAQISELKKTVEENQEEVRQANDANLVRFEKTVEKAIDKLGKKGKK